MAKPSNIRAWQRQAYAKRIDVMVSRPYAAGTEKLY